MAESYEDLLNQKFMEILKRNEETAYKLRKFLRKVVFDTVGVSVSFDEWHNAVVHFGPEFFNQDTFLYGSRFNKRLNNTKIKRTRLFFWDFTYAFLA